jgi:hypothetical protein
VSLRDILCDGEQSRHGAERATQIILIQACGYHPHARVRKLHADIDYAVVEKLGLIDSDHLDSEDELRSKPGGIFYHEGVQFAIIARDYAMRIEAIVYDRLENLRALARYLGAAYATDQLFALAAEHPSRDYFYPPAPRIQTVHLAVLPFLNSIGPAIF